MYTKWEFEIVFHKIIEENRKKLSRNKFTQKLYSPPSEIKWINISKLKKVVDPKITKIA